MSALGAMDPTPGVGIEALELFVEVLSQSDRDSIARDGFYDRLCEAVCRLARMRRAIIFRYDPATRRVRAAGAHGLSLGRVERAFVAGGAAPVTAPARAPHLPRGPSPAGGRPVAARRPPHRCDPRRSVTERTAARLLRALSAV